MLQELANGSAATGSGPAAALRYLRGLSVVQAFEVGMKVLTSAPSLRLCRLLVQFLMSLKVCSCLTIHGVLLIIAACKICICADPSCKLTKNLMGEIVNLLAN